MSTEGIDEMLAEAVREYPAIYDKSKKAHHDKNVIKNCWMKVAEVCGLEDHKEAIRLFGNLKKRFNKARSKGKLASGSAAKDVKKLSYTYLSWLSPHIVMRTAKTNLSKLKLIQQEANTETSSSSNEEIDQEDSEVDVEDMQVRDDTEALPKPTLLTNTIIKARPIETSPVEDTLFKTPTLHRTLSDHEKRKRDSKGSKARKISETTGRGKWMKKDNNDIEKAELAFFQAVEKSLKNPTPAPTPTKVASDGMDSNDLFARFVGSKLKELPARAQRLAQHEIENILFKISEQYETFSAPSQQHYSMQSKVAYSMSTPQQRLYPVPSQQQLYPVPSQQQPYSMQFGQQQYSMPYQQESYPISSENSASTQFEIQSPSLISSSEQQYQTSSPVYSTTAQTFVTQPEESYVQGALCENVIADNYVV